MRMIKRAWRNIPRSGRIAINLFAAAFALFFYYIFIGAPAFTAEQAYRRAERAALIGPAQILGTLDLNEPVFFDSVMQVPVTDETMYARPSDILRYDRLLLADDGDGIVFYCYDTDDRSITDIEGSLFYWEKTGPVTVTAAPSRTSFVTHEESVSVPILLFDSVPEAVYAELDLTLNSDYDNMLFEREYHLTAQRAAEGYFVFMLSRTSDEDLGAEGYAIKTLIELLDTFGSKLDVRFPAEARLYDEAGRLVYTQELTLMSPAARAHAERE